MNTIFDEGSFAWWDKATDESVGPARRSGELSQIVVRRVCEACNRGWMNDLEIAVRPILTPMILGNMAALTLTKQVCVAQWLWKTVLMFELSDEHRLIPDSEFRRFYAERWPPAGAHMWLMGWQRRAGRNWAARLWRGDLRIAKGTDPLPDEIGGYRSTIAVGHLAMQAIAPLLPKDGFRIGRRGGQPGLITEVWPTQAMLLQWPPHRFADEVGLEKFAARHIGRDLIPDFTRLLDISEVYGFRSEKWDHQES